MIFSILIFAKMHRNIVKIQIYCSINLRGVTAKLLIYSNRSWKSDNGKVELSPSYDLLNSSIVLEGEIEEIALPLKGKRRYLDNDLLINYFGKVCCKLNNKTIEKTIHTIQSAILNWFDLIEISFLSDAMKEKYRALLRSRINRFRVPRLS